MDCATLAEVFRTARGVAQSGSAPEWGSGGRWFESSRPDQFVKSEAAHVATAHVRRFCIISMQRARLEHPNGCAVRFSVLQSRPSAMLHHHALYAPLAMP